jgi:multiple sugar transport system permease protein
MKAKGVTMAKTVAVNGKKKSDFLTALPFMAPALLGLIVFVLWPGLRGVYLSFTEYNIFRPPVFTGLENYTRMVADPVFWNALWVTLEYVVINIAVQTVFALFIAVLMQRYTRSAVIRGVILLPYLFSNVIVALVWYWLADYNLGLINATLDFFNIDKITFFSDVLAMPTIALINVWRHVGYTALLIFAGLQAIPKDIYDASAVDGAGEWRTFRSITLPLLRPVLAFVLVITVTGSFQIFDTIAVTTNGGPIHATRTFSILIADAAWGNNEFGYASAISVALMVMLSLIAFAQTKLLSANQSDMDR